MRVQSVRWKIARRHLNHRPSHRLRWFLALLFTFLLITTSAAGATGLYFASHLPSISKFHVHYAFQNARIYDSQGGLLYNMADLSSQNRGRRVVEPLQELNSTQSACAGGVNRIPLLLQSATIATEDATFYKNPGFDVMSIARAAFQDIKYGHIISGASTITQQVVRATILTDERSLNRKAQEVALAYEISKKFSKRKILWYYLNSVPYGNLAIGAEAASEVYFGIPVCRLDLAQAALLAGLPRAPSLYDPVKYRSAAITRLNEVLKLLRLHGVIRYSWQADAVRAEARYWSFSPPQSRMRYPQFVRYVLDQIDTMPRIHEQLYQGIDIYTTIDPRLQDTAQNILTQRINGLTAQHVTDGALVSLDLRPQHYGWIVAMVGSANYRGPAGKINMADTPRQPGSSMKPFNYIWAFTHGNVGPGTTVLDSPIRLPDPYNHDPLNAGWYDPYNYDLKFHGRVTLREALANSLNIPAVKVEYYITGSNHVAQTARSFGMTSLYKDNPGLDCAVCYAVTLGGLAEGTRLVQETAAYGVFASGGWTVPPVALWKIVQRSTHRVLFCSADCPSGVQPPSWLTKRRHQVLDAAHAYEMTNVLSDDNARCDLLVCEFGLGSELLLDRPAAAKTGTTNGFTDNWTLGYTPQIVTGVWAGNADRTAMQNVIGVTGAAPIWHDYMEESFQILKLPVQQFLAPRTVIQTDRCSVPNSTYTRFGRMDLAVLDQTNTSGVPLCDIPEKGPMPVTCAHYPPPTRPADCSYGTYGSYATPNPYGNYPNTTDGTGQSTQPYTQGTVPQPPPVPNATP